MYLADFPEPDITKRRAWEIRLTGVAWRQKASLCAGRKVAELRVLVGGRGRDPALNRRCAVDDRWGKVG